MVFIYFGPGRIFEFLKICIYFFTWKNVGFSEKLYEFLLIFDEQ